MMLYRLRKNIQRITLASSLVLVCTAFAGSKLPYIPGSKTPVSVNIKNFKWHTLPTGGKIAYLVSRPDKPGIFIAVLKNPPGYTKAPHYHKTAAYLTILSGQYYNGHGNRFIRSKMKRIKKGDFRVNPAGYVHYERSKRGVTFEIVAIGPWKTIYVDKTGKPIKSS